MDKTTYIDLCLLLFPVLVGILVGTQIPVNPLVASLPVVVHLGWYLWLNQATFVRAYNLQLRLHEIGLLVISLILTILVVSSLASADV